MDEIGMRHGDRSPRGRSFRKTDGIVLLDERLTGWLTARGNPALRIRKRLRPPCSPAAPARGPCAARDRGSPARRAQPASSFEPSTAAAQKRKQQCALRDYKPHERERELAGHWEAQEDGRHVGRRK